MASNVGARLAQPIVVEFSPPKWSDGTTWSMSKRAFPITNYSHTISVGGGFSEVSFGLVASKEEVEQFIQTGVGAIITAYGVGGVVVWRGYVDTIDAGIGPISVVRGPFSEIANRVKVTYSTKRYNTTPPIGGNQQETAWASDALSQLKYGTRERVISGGEGTLTEMEYLRDSYLQDHKEPPASHALSVSSGQQLSISVTGRGLYSLLSDQQYDNDTGTGTSPIDELLLKIINANPDDIFELVAAFLIDSGIELPDYTDSWDFETILALLIDALNKGAPSGDRYMIGVYEDDQVRFEPISEKVDYTFGRQDTYIRLGNGSPVPPQLVRPGRWVLIEGLFSSAAYPQTLDDLRAHPGCVFIQSVRYTAPSSLELNGIRVSELRDHLANMGLSDMWG